MKEITISVKQIIISGNSLRGVQKNREIEIIEEIKTKKESKPLEQSQKVPNYNTVRQWLGRIGLYELQREKEKREDRTWIIDLSLELGTEKCLVILGVSEQYLSEKVWGEERGLNHHDLEVLHIEIMNSTRGELIVEVLKKITEKLGKPRQIISDRGSDLYKGIKLYRNQNPEVIHTYDITHQLALLLKKELKTDEIYQSYLKRCNQCRQELQQTELAFLRPPAQRSKSRYLNLDELIDWGKKTILYLRKEEKIKLNSSSEKSKNTKLKSQLGWLSKYESALTTWQEMLTMSRGIETQLKKSGLHQQSLLEFRQKFPALLSSSRLKNFREEIIRYLEKETYVIPQKNPMLASSDIIESIFGKYKFFSQRSPLKQLRRIILIIPLSTIDLKRDFIKEALENINNTQLKQWEEKIFGQSMLSKRRILFA